MQPAVWARIESRGVERVIAAVYSVANGADAAAWTNGVGAAIAAAIPGCRVSLAIADSTPRESSPHQLRVLRRIDATTGLECVLSFASPVESTSYQRSLLKRLSLHLENGARLVACPENVWGHLDRDGTCVAYGTDETNAAEVWSSLLSGRRSLVARAWGGETSYLVVNAPYGRWRALSADERAVTLRFVRGASSKLIASELGTSQPRVSRALHHAAAKVGVPTTRQLITVGALLENADRRGSEPTASALTGAEHAVMLLVREGYSNAEIAARRARAPRTIANQVASILKKTRCGSRRALSAVFCQTPSAFAPRPPGSGMFLSARAEAAAGERDARGAALAEG